MAQDRMIKGYNRQAQGEHKDLVVELCLTGMLHLLSSTVQLLILGPDLIVAGLVVLDQTSIVCLQGSHFCLQARHLRRELGILQPHQASENGIQIVHALPPVAIL